MTAVWRILLWYQNNFFYFTVIKRLYPYVYFYVITLIVKKQEWNININVCVYITWYKCWYTFVPEIHPSVGIRIILFFPVSKVSQSHINWHFDPDQPQKPILVSYLMSESPFFSFEHLVPEVKLNLKVFKGFIMIGARNTKCKALIP